MVIFVSFLGQEIMILTCLNANLCCHICIFYWWLVVFYNFKSWKVLLSKVSGEEQITSNLFLDLFPTSSAQWSSQPTFPLVKIEKPQNQFDFLGSDWRLNFRQDRFPIQALTANPKQTFLTWGNTLNFPTKNTTILCFNFIFVSTKKEETRLKLIKLKSNHNFGIQKKPY